MQLPVRDKYKNEIDLETWMTGSLEWLTRIYGLELAKTWNAEFLKVFLLFSRNDSKIQPTPVDSESSSLDQHTSILITYGDSIISPDGVDGTTIPLAILRKFLSKYIGSAISTVHLLPCYPSSSDDGFSVVNPFMVDPALGTWQDVVHLEESYRLMLDFVANHLSRTNEWIKEFLNGNPHFADFAITMTGSEDVKSVFRPRLLPLVTPIETAIGNLNLWTTFSADQIDLNYHNPRVLLRMLEVLLTYIQYGASIIRLDAVAFIWKELGTTCIHHPKTHVIIQYMRWIIDTLAPGRLLITETNVPHAENVGYFGDGTNEASLIYNFPLPPLVLHTFLTQDATQLSEWIATLKLPSKQVAFFNFLASHDGIGLVPTRGILSSKSIESLAEHVISQGGFVSKKTNSDGSISPYELNINYFSALKGITHDETESVQIDRFIAASAIMVCLQGIPGVYIHSLLGSENWNCSPDLATHPRRINREKLDFLTLSDELADPSNRRSKILSRYLQLLRVRREQPAFRTTSEQKIIPLGLKNVLMLLRIPTEKAKSVLCIINVSASPLSLEFTSAWRETLLHSGNTSQNGSLLEYRRWENLLDGCDSLSMEKIPITLATGGSIFLAPYEVMLLTPFKG